MRTLKIGNPRLAERSTSQAGTRMMCSSCNEEFDEEGRAVQILTCNHALCQSCLKELRQGDEVVCCICQVATEVRDLRNVTTDERFLGQWNEPETEVVWCVTCGTAFTAQCPEHRTVQIPSHSLAKCAAIQEKIDNCKLVMSSVVHLRQSIGQHLEERIQSLKSSAADVTKQLKQLETKLTLLNSLAADVDKQLTDNQSQLNNASNELQNLNTPTGERETLTSLEERVDALDRTWNSDLQSIARWMGQHETDRNRENTADIGNCSDVSSTSIRAQQTRQQENKMRRQISAVGREGRHFSARRDERFHHLIIKDGTSILGKIKIKPFWIIRSNFIVELRNFCHGVPRSFQSYISKSVPREYLTLELSSGRFAPADDREGSPINSQSGDRVELKRLCSSGEKRTRWQLIFNLGQSSKHGPRLDCLGHLVGGGRELIEYLGRKQLGKSLTVTWQYH